MPNAKCTGCDRLTNSATSNYISDTEFDHRTPKDVGVVTECYAAFVDGKWVKGCAYKYIYLQSTKVSIDKLIGKQDI